jgi:hypothetical protein
MTKLTDAQLIVLTSACKRDDGLAVLPAGMKPAAAAKLAAGLVNKGLVREIRAKSGTPIWREDEEGRKYSLKLLKAGREAIGVEEEGEEPDTVQPAADPTESARAGTKRALVIDLLQRPKGATLEELIAATGWLPHTTRAALSVLRRSGMVIERSRTETGKPSIYRIVAMPAAEAA